MNRLIIPNRRRRGRFYKRAIPGLPGLLRIYLLDLDNGQLHPISDVFKLPREAKRIREVMDYVIAPEGFIVVPMILRKPS